MPKTHPFLAWCLICRGKVRAEIFDTDASSFTNACLLRRWRFWKISGSIWIWNGVFLSLKRSEDVVLHTRKRKHPFWNRCRKGRNLIKSVLIIQKSPVFGTGLWKYKLQIANGLFWKTRELDDFLNRLVRVAHFFRDFGYCFIPFHSSVKVAHVYCHKIPRTEIT